MEGQAPYLDQLDSAIEKRQRWLESEQIPRLREALTAYESLFASAVSMLIRKGYLREDPYNYEQTFSDITIPKDEALQEFENSDELSYRLAAFRRQLKYASTEYPLDLAALNLAKLKKLSTLISYINWQELGESSKSPTTKAFARAFMKIRMGSDSMAAQILKDSETQIMKTTSQIRAQLADLIAFCRESWKADIRRSVLPAVTVSSEGHSRREEMVKNIRRGFANRLAGKPWYPTLAEEIADEELGEDGEDRKANVLASLKIVVPEKPKVVEAPDGRAILLEAVRLLSRPSEDLATAVAVLEENERVIIEAQTANVGWLRRLFGGGHPAQKPEDRVYKVQYAEPGVPTPKSEEIDFPQFVTEVQKKSSLLAALGTGSGPAFKKLAAVSEPQLAAFLDKQLNELLLIHRRLGCMNTMLQARVMQEKKTVRGIKIELLTIKNAIVKANQRRHEYKETG
jgi:hypothetical protein